MADQRAEIELVPAAKAKREGSTASTPIQEREAGWPPPLRIVARNDEIGKADWGPQFRRLRLKMRLAVAEHLATAG